MYRLVVFSVLCGLAFALPQRLQSDDNNPCTAQALADGNIYFSVPGDNTEFIECDLLGNANVLSCPAGLVWDESRLSCVYNFGVDSGNSGSGSGSGTTAGTGTGAGSETTPSTGNGDGGLKNPCTQENIANGNLFFPFSDAGKFIQCDIWGDAYVVNCPSGLVWNVKSETCASAFIQVE